MNKLRKNPAAVDRTVSAGLMRRADGDRFKLMAAVLFVLALLTMAAGCGDPGTGGSGVPTGTAAEPPANSAAPGGDAQGTTANTPLPAAAISPQWATLRGTIAVFAAAPTAQPLAQIVVAGTRVNMGTARFVSFDGSGRSGADLLPGVPVVVSYPQGSDLMAAATGAAGPALDAQVIVVTDPLPGRLILGGTRPVVQFDDGRQIPVAAAAVVSGVLFANARVRAWIAADASGISEVSRYEAD